MSKPRKKHADVSIGPGLKAQQIELAAEIGERVLNGKEYHDLLPKLADVSTPPPNGTLGPHRFLKGNRVNPEGRRMSMQKYVFELMTMARGFAPEAFVVLRRIMLNPMINAESRIKAATAIIDRGFGPPNVAFSLITQQPVAPLPAPVNVQVNHQIVNNPSTEHVEPEFRRLAEIAQILETSGALRAVARLGEPRQVEPVGQDQSSLPQSIPSDQDQGSLPQSIPSGQDQAAPSDQSTQSSGK